ncbi:hypothetical protein LguiA_015621 [Lonicera macranthoides]
MAGGSLSPRSDKSSIKYRYSPHEGAFFDLADLDREDYAPNSSRNNKENDKKCEPKSHEILSTTELISAIGQIWDGATRPLSLFLRQTNSKHNNADLQEGSIFCYPEGEGIVSASTSGEGRYWSVNYTTHSSSTVKASLECLKVTQKVPFFEPYSSTSKSSRSSTYSPFWRCLQSSSVIPIESCWGKGLAVVGISGDFRNVYAWMKELTDARLKYHIYSTQMGDKKTDDYHTTGDTSSPVSYHCTEINKRPELALGQSAKRGLNTSAAITDCFIEPVQDIVANDSVSRLPVSALATSACEENEHKTVEVDIHESKNYQRIEFITEEKSTLNIVSSAQDKPHYVLAKKEHAFAGAFAGVFVSVCLHPVDTIKTVTQSCRSDQKSIHHISRLIISERGVTGLYRGIASNIASSAPISAVYAFTYESVKGALLPHFAKEYHSLAHCIAGGCASIATSFIFTPSERIKQQMQVGSHYQNCWTALIGIVKKGGFSSLYTGWGAVLCRNVPHSIIKFYTYESLKQLKFSSPQSNAQPNTLLTLVSGGLAGSTAALFTTPFDVVKTRLQTQIPGSMNQYEGVFSTLKEIAECEGLKGLYRGLTPRLVMYMTQGALFFASYESFKRLFSVDLAQVNAQTTPWKEKVEEDELTSLSTAA